jgi:putative two-component system response regulator
MLMYQESALQARVAGQPLEIATAFHTLPVTDIILVASAQAEFVGQLRPQLYRLGAQAASVADARQVLETALSCWPALIVLDAQLPEAGALFACMHIKGTPLTREIPVLIVDWTLTPELRLKTIEAGADACFSLATERAEMRARARILLEERRRAAFSEPTESVVLSLAHAVAARDGLTGGHLARLGDEALLLGQRLGLDAQLRQALRYSAMLHDVGKIGIDDALLHKPGPLTADERRRIEAHPLIGERIVQPLRLAALVGPAIRGHHERWDGQGYPDRLVGEDIPYLARVVSVLDAFDAMTTPRLYAPTRSIREARKILRDGAGAQWDPTVVDVFDRWLEVMPLRVARPAQLGASR